MKWYIFVGRAVQFSSKKARCMYGTVLLFTVTGYIFIEITIISSTLYTRTTKLTKDIVIFSFKVMLSMS
jgi:hypothetical protein